VGDDIYTWEPDAFEENSTSAIVGCVSTNSNTINLSHSYYRNVSSTITSSNSSVFDWVCLKKKK
jgi:hypothetical protein